MLVTTSPFNETALEGRSALIGGQCEFRSIPDFEGDRGLDRLSPQQRRVLSLLSEGLCNKRIAQELGVVEATAKVHVSSLIKGFGCSNRTQVALIALRIRYGLPLGEIAFGRGE